jgi:hypothetical protein
MKRSDDLLHLEHLDADHEMITKRTRSYIPARGQLQLFLRAADRIVTNPVAIAVTGKREIEP